MTNTLPFNIISGELQVMSKLWIDLHKRINRRSCNYRLKLHENICRSVNIHD